MEKTGAIFPILCQAGGQLGQYSTGGVPAAYLIAADGTVAWQGHPGDINGDMLENHLKDVEKPLRVPTASYLLTKSMPPLPEKLKGIRKQLEKGKLGAALKKVESTVPKLEGDDADAGEAVRAWIEGVGNQGLEKAAAFVRDGFIHKGFLEYEKVEDRFKGHALSKMAKGEAKALKSDKAHGLEIKASEKLIKAKKAMADERKNGDKLKCLKPLLAKKYAETRAGQEAAALAEKLESGG